MARAPCTFRRADVKRLVQAVRAAGVPVQRVELGADGKIIIVADNPLAEANGRADAPADWSDAK